MPGISRRPTLPGRPSPSRRFRWARRWRSTWSLVDEKEALTIHVTHETPEQTDHRLRRIAARASVDVLAGDWCYDEFPLDEFAARVRPEAVALVRDGDCWSQLAPVRGADQPGERLRVWCFHFPEHADNSGFVGWLATRLKAKTGSGILVVCGRNAARGGIYDYWACPVAAAASVLSEVRALAAPSLDGRRMRAVATAAGGEVDADTLFTFVQQGSTVWAHYAGGEIEVGYLAGTLAAERLRFRYVQVHRNGDVHGGRSHCDVSTLPDGRVRLMEHFQWESREGSGTNLLEEVEASPVGTGRSRRRRR